MNRVSIGFLCVASCFGLWSSAAKFNAKNLPHLVTRFSVPVAEPVLPTVEEEPFVADDVAVAVAVNSTAVDIPLVADVVDDGEEVQEEEGRFVSDVPFHELMFPIDDEGNYIFYDAELLANSTLADGEPSNQDSKCSSTMQEYMDEADALTTSRYDRLSDEFIIHGCHLDFLQEETKLARSEFYETVIREYPSRDSVSGIITCVMNLGLMKYFMRTYNNPDVNNKVDDFGIACERFGVLIGTHETSCIGGSANFRENSSSILNNAKIMKDAMCPVPTPKPQGSAPLKKRNRNAIKEFLLRPRGKRVPARNPRISP